MHTKTLTELSYELSNKRISSVELTNYFLERIKRLNPTLNALITLTEDQALNAAQAADAQRAQGQAGPLTGLPLIHKDIFCTQGVRTSCGSKMLDNFIAPYDATVVTRFKEAGMVMLGKANMDEFAMGSSNENSYYGPVRNPWDLERVPGGSSGGSAAAVAACLAPAATGTDTGGSIRQPASLCGLSGLKPTYGRVSRFGMVAFASSLDQGGVFAHSAEDMAHLLQVMAGYDPKDSTSVNKPVPDYSSALNTPIKGKRIGLPKEFMTDALEPSLQRAVEQAMDVLKSLGVEFTSISLPSTQLAIPAYYVIAPAECSSNLARFDGVRYGYRADNPKHLIDLYERSRQEGFGDEVKRRIMIGTYALSSGYYDAYYAKAQKLRRLITDEITSALSEVDFIIGPTSPSTAFKLGEKSGDPVSMYLSDIYTISFSLAGLPGLSVPMGFNEGLPIGLQMVGKHFDEASLLNLAHQYQLATDWHRRLPEGID